MKVEGQLREAQLELLDNTQVAETKGRISYNKDCEAPVIDTGTDLKRLQTVDNDPVGVIKMWPTEVVPAGFFLCQGQHLDRVIYAELFAALGTRYGVGDGSTTFELPDYRGVFLRSSDLGSSQDPDRASRTDRGDGTTGDVVGTRQADAYKSHLHQSLRSANNNGWPAQSGDTSATSGPGYWTGRNTAPNYNTSSAGGNETRPKNVTINFIIKAK